MVSSPSPSFSSPSSSAVTIPVPGKSILKHSTPAQNTLLSRITRFLPNQTQIQPSSEDVQPLKRAHFILPEIAVVYPISSVNPPSTPTLKEEKRSIEDREYERRRRVLRGNSGSGKDGSDDFWSMEKVESFYRECCAGCDEQPDTAISTSFKNASPSNPRCVDFSGVQLNSTSASILSDVFTLEWGLRKLILRECDLDDFTLKPILHSLLIPGTLSYLSIASNRRFKAPAFRLVGAYASKAKTLQFLDVSQNSLDKKSVEYIVAALTPAPEQGILTLRMDDCQLRPAALETLCRAVRTSSLRHISLRYNRISASGAVALALMIRDYPDVVPAPLSPSPFSSTPSTPTSSTTNLPLPSSPTSPVPPPAKLGPVLPPPRHPTATSVQTTYTPYVPRSKRGNRPPSITPIPLTLTGQQIPIITSSSQGGVTARHPPPPPPVYPDTPRHNSGPSAALLDKVRALDNLPRLGALRTLDLKGNDLRNGIIYISQVLKRNRTLKVLNMSENKLDVQCLVTIAEALKYNSCLETLDLSKNPCCGPGLEGIQSLRTAFTLNTALKRLFLSSTHMTSAGAIALAEFLPESMSLLHLDLANNVLDIAAVMALSSGLKANHVMRCLDLNIPENDDEFSRMCREILNTCIRNTEEAENAQNDSSGGNSRGGGIGKGVWGMIEESSLARSIRLNDGKQNAADVVVKARRCTTELNDVLSDPSRPTGSRPDAELADKAHTVLAELTTAIQDTEDAVRLQELLGINDQLRSLLAKIPAPQKPTLVLQGLGVKKINGSALVSGDGSVSSGTVDPQNGHAARHDELTTTPNGVYVEGGTDDTNEDDDTPTTPRIDKGKARAEPEPEVPEKVLSPTFLITESESEDEEARYATDEEVEAGRPSPTHRSRIWVAEEGEVFRKGTVLLGPEEMEGEYDGEELRRELLEAMVERPPPRPITIDEFGLEMSPLLPEQEPRVSSPPEPAKPPPKPYIPRRANSNSSSPIATYSSLQTPTMQSQLRSPTSPVASPQIPDPRMHNPPGTT
ncbi:hypothetical protein F5887DRAFT_1076994 [Amanita rubescens]|nr:hypothetical protein F5887DRAFT_1076994 [Amanita rubescens]